MTAYYNDNDAYVADWLDNLIHERLIAPGEVDRRSIVAVRPADLVGFDQCHFFAGIGGWSAGLRLAGWRDDRKCWTGSCPCGPFSGIGKQLGFDDERHLWPAWHELIRECRPTVIFGEQVASASAWLRLVRSDMEALGYAVGAIPFEAASAGADHLRDRFWFVGDDPCQRHACAMVDRVGTRLERLAGYGVNRRRWKIAPRSITTASSQQRADFEWFIGADGKARRAKSGIRLLANDVHARVDKLRALGNAVVPQAAAAFIAAYMDLCHD